MKQTMIIEIDDERSRQCGKGYDQYHDDEKDTKHFSEVISDYANWARRMSEMGSDDKARRRLIQVAALAIAAVESIDRKRGRA